MITTTFLILLAFATIGCAVASSASKTGDDPYVVGAFACGVVGAVWTAFAVTTIVGANEVGVPITLGRAGDAVQSGVQWHAPWTTIQKLPTRAESSTTCAQVRTAQSGSVKVCTTARWAVDRDKARTVYLNTRTSDAEKIAAKIVQPYQRQASNFVYSKYDNVTAINSREVPQQAITAALKASLATQGLRLDGLMLDQAEPDRATADSTARYAAEVFKTKIAQQSVLTAEQEALRKVAEADGTRAAAAKLPTLSDQELKVLCVQAWQEAASAATARGIPLYTHPCGGGADVMAK